MAKILIVEDDKRTNMAICEYLKPTGHNIVSAYDGEEALQLLVPYGNILLSLIC